MNIFIEYDGIQHFKPVKQWDGVKNLKRIQTSDETKDFIAKVINIRLIRITYKEKNKNDEILTKRL